MNPGSVLEGQRSARADFWPLLVDMAADRGATIIRFPTSGLGPWAGPNCGKATSLEEAIAKADTLIEALGWIRQFRDKITVIKLGGSVMEDETALRHVLLDIVFMETVGMRPVVVHGGGAAISRAMEAAGIKARFVQGRRYTDEATLEIVEQVLAIETNEHIARRIEELGGRAMNLNFRTTNVLFGEQIDLTGDDGQPLDLGYVGNGHARRSDRHRQPVLCRAGPRDPLDVHRRVRGRSSMSMPTPRPPRWPKPWAPKSWST